MLRKQLEQLEQELSEVRNAHNQSQTAFVEQFEAISTQHGADKEALLQKHVDEVGALTRKHEESRSCLSARRACRIWGSSWTCKTSSTRQSVSAMLPRRSWRPGVQGGSDRAHHGGESAGQPGQGEPGDERSGAPACCAHEKMALLSNQHHEQLEKLLADRRSERDELEAVRRDCRTPRWKCSSSPKARKTPTSSSTRWSSSRKLRQATSVGALRLKTNAC